MARSPLMRFFQDQSYELPEEGTPEYEYTESVIARHKREGLVMAVRARWFAMFVVGILMLFAVPWPEVLFYEFILLLIALNGFLMLRYAKVGLSRVELILIFLDLAIFTAGMVIPNPLSTLDWPQAMQFQLENFKYFFILLALGTMAYSWRTVVAIGTWTSGMWAFATFVSWWFADPHDDLGATVRAAYGEHEALAYLMDPTSFHFGLRIQEIVLFLVVALTLAVSVRRSNRLLRSNAALERERTNLSRYFSPNVVEELSTNDEPLKQIRSHDIAVLFVDIVHFTEYAAARDPEEVIKTLREFHGLMEKSVFAHNGTLDKYLGDGLMVTFGTPKPTDNDAINALRCVHDMMDALDEWNNDRIARGQTPLRVGFGVHYGPAVLADIGAHRLEFTVVGNTVNIASRLEALTRGLNARVVISDGMRAEVIREGGHECLDGLRRYEEQDIRGVEQKLTVWALGRPSDHGL